MLIDLFFVLFTENFIKESHLSQSSWKYEQYIHKYCFMIEFMFSIWSFISEWCMIESCASIFNLVHNVFQNVETNWLSWSDTIMSDNLCNLKTFLIKTSTIVSTSRNSKAMRCCSFMSLSTTIMMFVYSLLFSRSMMKSIKISYHYYIKIDIDYNTFCFYLWEIFSCIQIWHSCMYYCIKSCISNQ